MEDIRIRAEINDAENTYPNLRTELFTKDYFKYNHEIFTTALLIGKYMIEKRKPLKKSKEFIRLESVENKDEIDILKCIAIEETKDVTIINDYKKIFEICEEYANCGIKELIKWTKDKEEFETKISTFLLDTFEENINIYNEHKE